MLAVTVRVSDIYNNFGRQKSSDSSCPPQPLRSETPANESAGTTEAATPQTTGPVEVASTFSMANVKEKSVSFALSFTEHYFVSSSPHGKKPISPFDYPSSLEGYWLWELGYQVGEVTCWMSSDKELSLSIALNNRGEFRRFEVEVYDLKYLEKFPQVQTLHKAKGSFIFGFAQAGCRLSQNAAQSILADPSNDAQQTRNPRPHPSQFAQNDHPTDPANDRGTELSGEGLSRKKMDRPEDIQTDARGRAQSSADKAGDLAKASRLKLLLRLYSPDSIGLTEPQSSTDPPVAFLQPLKGNHEADWETTTAGSRHSGRRSMSANCDDNRPSRCPDFGLGSSSTHEESWALANPLRPSLSTGDLKSSESRSRGYTEAEYNEPESFWNGRYGVDIGRHPSQEEVEFRNSLTMAYAESTKVHRQFKPERNLEVYRRSNEALSGDIINRRISPNTLMACQWTESIIVLVAGCLLNGCRQNPDTADVYSQSLFAALWKQVLHYPLSFKTTTHKLLVRLAERDGNPNHRMLIKNSRESLQAVYEPPRPQTTPTAERRNARVESVTVVPEVVPLKASSSHRWDIKSVARSCLNWCRNNVVGQWHRAFRRTSPESCTISVKRDFLATQSFCWEIPYSLFPPEEKVHELRRSRRSKTLTALAASQLSSLLDETSNCLWAEDVVNTERSSASAQEMCGPNAYSRYATLLDKSISSDAPLPCYDMDGVYIGTRTIHGDCFRDCFRGVWELQGSIADDGSLGFWIIRSMSNVTTDLAVTVWSKDYDLVREWSDQWSPEIQHLMRGCGDVCMISDILPVSFGLGLEPMKRTDGDQIVCTVEMTLRFSQQGGVYSPLKQNLPLSVLRQRSSYTLLALFLLHHNRAFCIEDIHILAILNQRATRPQLLALILHALRKELPLENAGDCLEEYVLSLRNCGAPQASSSGRFVLKGARRRKLVGIFWKTFQKLGLRPSWLSSEDFELLVRETVETPFFKHRPVLKRAVTKGSFSRVARMIQADEPFFEVFVESGARSSTEHKRSSCTLCMTPTTSPLALDHPALAG